jgi:putative toxin-antitoxin system antitoxin component (TIGR02293 family)
MSEAANIIKVLGGEKVIGRKVKTTEDLLALVHRGLPYESYSHVSRTLGGRGTPARERVILQSGIRRTASGVIEITPMSDPFGIHPRTLARRRTERRLSPEESDRVLRVARILAKAQEVFADKPHAQEWLASPCRAIGGKVPAQLLDTDLGAKTVDEELTRIAHGVYA